ncbi:ABC transporter ATP-binding protein [Mesorhizobium delmotii]|uniref:Dipeptide transporter ATP-binding component of ABC superfamily n=1 Tax=Mesorhizobium delmotii TaxID=1631247 RepID=A0A2P9AMX8_9HYPH|nr:ABC transporter ATP-binding protein [Mesorhizobium delmotii]SJM32510.1 dipeptide transporter; ATP-binding component of ABC superfamily [Mesorhizobium delmotii]
MQELIRIEQLSVGFGDAQALRGVDIAVHAGETVGMIGESGSGKSVTWLGAVGLLPQAATVSGRVILEGQDILHASAARLTAIRGKRIAMIFQDATSALNPVHTVGGQVTEVLRLHRGIDGRAARAEARRLFEQVGIPDAGRRLDAYPHELSGGQNQRVMIAVALAGQPDLLVADEPTTALDVTIQAQILDLLRSIQRDTGMALVLISHDLGVIAEVCSRTYVMYAGRIVEEAPVTDLFAAPLHPYTRGLLDAIPSLEGPPKRLSAIPGAVPAATTRHAGCAFAPRCPIRVEKCGSDPVLLPPRGGHRAACMQLHESILEGAA